MQFLTWVERTPVPTMEGFCAIGTRKSDNTTYDKSVTKIRGTLSEWELDARQELKAITPWVIIGSSTHRFAKGELR